MRLHLTDLKKSGNSNGIDMWEHAESILHYSGTFNEEMLKSMGSYLKTRFTKHPEISGRIFSIFMELAQNISLHSANKDNLTQKGIGKLEVYDSDEKVDFAATNLMSIETFNKIIAHCNKINILSIKDLRALKREIRSRPRISSQKGGNIGLVQVALKAESILRIAHETINDTHCLFTISTSIAKENFTIMNTIIEVDDLIITGEHSTYFTPNVHFSASTGQCSILGESYLEDAFDFYDTLIDWFKKYYASGRDNVVLDFKLSYFNTSSSRAIVDLIRVLKGFWDEGKNITINWHYPNPDYDDLKIEGEDFAEETGFPVSFVEYTKK